MKQLTRIVALVLTGFAISASANGVIRRDWVVHGPGGQYGFVEIDESPSASIYSKHDLVTLACAGPMHLQLPFSAPITIVITLVPLASITGFALFAVLSKRARNQ